MPLINICVNDNKTRNNQFYIAVCNVKCVFCPPNEPIEMQNCDWAGVYVGKCRAAKCYKIS